MAIGSRCSLSSAGWGVGRPVTQRRPGAMGAWCTSRIGFTGQGAGTSSCSPAIIAASRLALHHMPAYYLTAPYSPKGDQPTAIKQLVAGVNSGERYQTLLGATGTGDVHDGQRHRPDRPACAVPAHNKLGRSAL